MREWTRLAGVERHGSNRSKPGAEIDECPEIRVRRGSLMDVRKFGIGYA